MDTLELLAVLTDKLIKLEFRQQVFFHKAPCLFLITDMRGTIQGANPAWNKILGWEDADLQDQNWVGLVHPDDRLMAKRILEHEHPHKTLLRFRTKAGDYKTILFNAPDYDRHGLAYCVGVEIGDSHAGK